MVLRLDLGLFWKILASTFSVKISKFSDDDQKFLESQFNRDSLETSRRKFSSGLKNFWWKFFSMHLNFSWIVSQKTFKRKNGKGHDDFFLYDEWAKKSEEVNLSIFRHGELLSKTVSGMSGRAFWSTFEGFCQVGHWDVIQQTLVSLSSVRLGKV